MAYLERRQAIISAIATALIGMATLAIAQPMMGSGPGHGPGMMGGFGDTESYLASLKSELAISANQEAAWKDYAGAVSGAHARMEGHHQSMFDAMGTATWRERRNMMNRMFETRKEAFDSVHEAAVHLMTVLTPAQQTKAQGILPGLAFGRGMMERRGHGGGSR
jgi:hypothetical protein